MISSNEFHFFRGKRTNGSDCKCSHQKSTDTPEWKKKFEEGSKRSIPQQGSVPRTMASVHSGRKGPVSRGRTASSSARRAQQRLKRVPTLCEAGSEKKKKKKKAKAAPVISTERSSSEEDIVDSDAETECAPATLRAKL